VAGILATVVSASLMSARPAGAEVAAAWITGWVRARGGPRGGRPRRRPQAPADAARPASRPRSDGYVKLERSKIERILVEEFEYR
jgi:hypothetical protein